MTFTTERLPLAVYLHATADLNFSHCKKIADDKVSFVFFDPSQKGNDLRSLNEEDKFRQPRYSLVRNSYVER